ncbi:MAG TPA: hypothetical protein VF719_12000, partial [Abditibacteriaceae bacterium]
NLLDAAGKKLIRNGSRMSQENNKMTLELTFSRTDFRDRAAEIGEPAKLSWELPGDVAAIIVPFEFKDIPLP